MNVKKIFEGYVKCRDVVNKQQKAVEDMVNILTEGNGDGFISFSAIEGYLLAVKNIYPELAEDLERYEYEYPMINEDIVIEVDGKGYTISNDDDFLEYLINKYENKK